MTIVTRLIRAALSANSKIPNRIIAIPIANIHLYDNGSFMCGSADRSDFVGIESEAILQQFTSVTSFH
jgi:hypothetical protein